MVVPLSPNLSYVFKWFEILIKEILWKLAHVSAILELGSSYLVDVSEVSVFVQDLMDLVLYLGLQIEILQQSWNHIANVLSFGIFVFDNLFLDSFLNGPENVGVSYLFEDQLSFFVVG